MELEIRIRQKRIKLYKEEQKEKSDMPVMVSIRAKDDQLDELDENRVPVDLICVIDNSGSMSGEKIKLV